MVGGSTSGAGGTGATSDAGRLMRLVEVARRFLAALPAFALGLVLLRLAELAEGWPPGATAGAGSLTVAAAFAQDLLVLGRFLPALFLISLPVLALRTQRVRFWGIGIFWSALLLVQLGLVAYFPTREGGRQSHAPRLVLRW